MKGRAAYAENELSAEISACMVFANLGRAPDLEQSAAYIESWLTALRGDKKFIFRAASRAQTIADHVHERATNAGMQRAA